MIIIKNHNRNVYGNMLKANIKKKSESYKAQKESWFKVRRILSKTVIKTHKIITRQEQN